MRVTRAEWIATAAGLTWDRVLSLKQRSALVDQLSAGKGTGYVSKSWQELPEEIKTTLLRIDWEMSLGRRF